MASPERPAPDQRLAAASAEPVAKPPPARAQESPTPVTGAPLRKGWRRWLPWILGAVGLFLVLFEGVPWLRNALRTVSTDDAYVNGHVTFVAARVAGQVT